MTVHNRLGEHAVVIGGSIGGLLTGRVLAGHFDRVTILDRDQIPDGPEPRKGVPQGRHVHTLFSRGADVVESLLPGFWKQLVKDGATEFDFAKDLAWYQQGVWKMQSDAGLRSFWMSRPFLESRIRQRVLETENIEFIDQADVTKLVTNDDKSRVTGVQAARRNGEADEVTLDAELVIDAGGRGSRVPTWLESLGYQRAAEETVELNVTYASRILERPTDTMPQWTALGIYGMPPKATRTGYIFPIEGNRWLASCVGFLGDRAPDDDEGWLEFARSLERPDFYEAVRSAKPLSPVSVYNFPSQLRRHYERLTRFPEGLLVLGDAVCAFNPVYGQGMSACALQVGELQDMLQSCSSTIPPGLAKQLFRRTGKLIDNPWLLATSADFLYPQAKGKRRFGSKLLLWYLRNVLELSACNKRVVQTFHRVLHFEKATSAFFHPAIAFQVLKRAIGLRSRKTPLSDRPLSG